MTKAKVALTAMMMVPLLFGVNQAHAQQEVPPSSVSAMNTLEVPVTMFVGNSRYLAGSGFILNGGYGVITLDRSGYVFALAQGTASVSATLDNGQRVVYYITVNP